MLWNEDNFDINQYPYAVDAQENGPTLVGGLSKNQIQKIVSKVLSARLINLQ